MSSWTPFGSGLWDWPPFYHLSPVTRLFFLALYTAPHAKNYPAGLWHGGISVMAESVRMGAADTHASLAELELARLADGRPLIEHDPVARVLRIVELPDRFDRPANGSALKRWWNMFRAVPACAVRDRHIATLRGVMGEMTSDHEQVWAMTFGTISIPVDNAPVAVGEVQASLPFGHGVRDGVAHGVGHGVGHRVADLPNSLEDAESGHRVGHRVRHPQVPDQVRVQVPDPDSEAFEPVDERDEPDVRSPLPFSVADLVRTIADKAGPRFLTAFDSRLAPALVKVIRQVAANGWGLPEVALAGEWLGAGGLAWQSTVPGPKWASATGNLVEVIGQAHAWNAAGRPKILRHGAAPQNPARGRAEPAEPPAFRSGRKSL